ncbi:MAG: bifunctional lysylphosphatidylglycerol flippase/synthetase MprF [Oligoflexia bacterium]|nr:bifunctional lysylphosphatidylglycerol flippase/synthetase MprF [Oligoflexia bacterium]
MNGTAEESQVKRWIARVAVFALFALALFVLHDLLQHYHYHEISHEIRRIPSVRLIWAGIFCLLNYFVLTFYDTLANYYVGKDLPYRRTALTAFISYTFSQNLGFALLSGGAVRFRLYTAWGFSSVDVAKIIAFAGFNFWLGLLSLFGALCLADPHMITSITHAGTLHAAYLIGLACLSPLAVYLSSCAFGKKTLRLWSWELPLPQFGLALAAVTVACLDWSLAAATLYALLPSTVSFLDFVAAYFAAQAVGVVSHVPGGLGVFEALMLMAFGSAISGQTLVGALIVYRLIYYIIPFAFGALVFALYELRRNGLSTKLSQANSQVEALVRGIIPPFLSMVVFAAGIVLLISGATPSLHSRLSLLSRFVPLSVLELSHFTASAIGLALLFLAWSIQKRIRSAYFLTLTALLLGALASLGKGADFEEALWMLASFLLLLPCRRYFYRSAALFSGMSWAMVGAICCVLSAVIWIGLFSYKHVAYTHDMWWQFTFDGDAPRFLRATLGLAFALSGMSLWWLLRPARVLSEHLPSVFELEEAKQLLVHAKTTLAHLVLSGDKSILFNSTREAFLMFRRSGRSFIALGDPVGSEAHIKELIWQFRDLCDRSDAYCVFYQVPSESLPTYLDIGLLPYKLGEEGFVDLQTFTLEGGSAKGLRRTVSKTEKDGFSFVIYPSVDSDELLPKLRTVSDQWLASKHTREKGFSVGSFSNHYLSQFPVATVQQGDKIVAFANLIATQNKYEIAIDLMRYSGDAPDGCMEYLFIKLIVFAQSQGYKFFNLGMAPLSGLESRRLAPRWQRFGALLYDKGEYFYNFDGLRRFKEKFHPHWHPRYILSPGGLALPRTIAAVTTLIAGGWKGVFSK